MTELTQQRIPYQFGTYVASALVDYAFRLGLIKGVQSVLGLRLHLDIKQGAIDEAPKLFRKRLNTRKKEARQLLILNIERFFEETWRAALEKRAGILEDLLLEEEAVELLPEIQALIVTELSKVPELEYVLYRSEGPTNVVISIIEHFNVDVRHKIYESQRSIIRSLPDYILDFYVLAREGKDPREFLPTDISVIYERANDTESESANASNR